MYAHCNNTNHFAVVLGQVEHVTSVHQRQDVKDEEGQTRVELANVDGFLKQSMQPVISSDH